jgi:acid phosphatase family membrane protein YuiD
MSIDPSSISYTASKGWLSVILAWVLAQTVKMVIGCVREKRWNFKYLLAQGGMPSTHSAAVAATATAVGFYYGFGSVPFGVVVVFSLITMFDAAGVRRAVGRQATVLNKVMEDLYTRGQVPEKRLKELLGHTPVEVFIGAAFGIVVVWLLRY